jgi:tryptophan-rich sensory protein
MKKQTIFKLIISIASPLLVGGISSFFTANEVQGLWFTTLIKPSFNPPNYLFGPVWTVLYILMGISLFMVWQTPKSAIRNKAIAVFCLQLFFNFWWSILFFKFHLLFISLVNIILLLVLIAYMIICFKKVKSIAAYLQIPYLLWVSFATSLNVSFWFLN